MEDDLQLSQALSQLSEASDINSDNEELEEVARVRKARAGVTERARQNGDCVANLLSGLIDDSNAEIEAEKAEKERKARELKEKKLREAEAAKNKELEEAQNKLLEEKRKLEEKEQRRQQMLIDMEKQRRLEAGEVDEEEEARKRMEAEAEANRIAAEKAREEAEAAQLASANEELEEQLRIAKANKAAEEAADAANKRKMLMIRNTLIAAIVVIISGFVAYKLATLKAPDYYTLNDNYGTVTMSMQNEMKDAVKGNIIAMNDKHVTQEAPKTQSRGGGHKGPAKDTGITVSNVFDSKTITK